MIKTLVIIILLFNGTIAKDTISFNPSIDITECSALANAYREIFSSHRWGDQRGAPDFTMDYMRHGWYLNDGRGTIQGYYCE
tara:strand:+ start:1153 stop:1398 length:246 start_codon:yes stop_codon:yes gene_type:complete